MDWESGLDQIQISDNNYSFSNLTITQENSDTIIDISTTQSIVLKNVDGINAGDFIFSN